MHESETAMPRAKLRQWDSALDRCYSADWEAKPLRKRRRRKGISKAGIRVAYLVEDCGVEEAAGLVGIDKVLECLDSGISASSL
jgi:hypothetical protein